MSQQSPRQLVLAAVELGEGAAVDNLKNGDGATPFVCSFVRHVSASARLVLFVRPPPFVELLSKRFPSAARALVSVRHFPAGGYLQHERYRVFADYLHALLQSAEGTAVDRIAVSDALDVVFQ